MKASELISKLANIITEDGDREVEILFFVQAKDLSDQESAEISGDIQKVVSGYSKNSPITISNLPF